MQELPDDDRRAELEVDLRSTVQIALGRIKGHASTEAEHSALRAIALSQRPGINWEKSWQALASGVWLVAVMRPDIPKAREIATELLAIAARHGDDARTAIAVYLLNIPNMYAGAFDLAAEGWDRLTAPYEKMPEFEASLRSPASAWRSILDAYAYTQALRALNLWYLGYPDRALERANSATAIASEAGRTVGTANMYSFAVEVFCHRRELKRTREMAETSVGLSELDTIFHGTRGQFFLGWVDASSGNLAHGVARMRGALQEYRAAGSGLDSEYYLALIATALGQMKQFDEGLRTIDEAFGVIERGGARANEAEVHRLKGELLRAQDSSNVARAEESFRTAIEISRKQHAKSWELRATTSLARLLRDTNRRDEARAMLAEIYNWFTEGFDTADLKDAKSLLDQLNG